MPETLQFGAYGDAVPPVYVAYKLQEPPISAYVPHTEFRENLPIEFDEVTALKLLWQVKSLDIKIEYTLENDLSGEWPRSSNVIEPQEIILESVQLSGLGSVTNGWEERPLKIPQGRINVQTPPYAEDGEDNREIAREGFGVINSFNPGDLANWDNEQSLSDAPLKEEKQAILQKIAEIKQLANDYEYLTLEAEIERQEQSFNQNAEVIISKFKTDLQQLVTQFTNQNPPSWSTYVKSLYAQNVQRIRDKALFDIRQEKHLQWFEWDGGFDKKIAFNEIARMQIMANKALHRPPNIGGIFSGLAASTASPTSLPQKCIGFINPSQQFSAINFEFAFNKSISYQQRQFIDGQDEQPREVSIDDIFSIFCSENLFKSVSTVEEIAEKIYIKPANIYGRVKSGEYLYVGQTEGLYEGISYSSLYNLISDKVEQGPPFEKNSQYSPEQKEVIYSGEFFGGGDFGAAKEFFAPIAAKIETLKKPSPAKECGFFRIKNKNGNNIVQKKLYCRSVLPLKDVAITYQIQSYHTDPPPEPTP